MRKAGLGIDIGNGSISIVVVEGENIIYKDYRLHRGELYQNLVDMLGQVETSCGDRILYAAVNPGAVWFVSGDPKESADQPHQQPSGRTENALSGRGKHRRDGSTEFLLPYRNP